MSETSFFYEFKGEQIREGIPLNGKKEVTVIYEDNKVYEVWIDGYEFDYDMPWYRNNPYQIAETHLTEGE